MAEVIAKMVALDLALYKIHGDGYAPINEIRDFWEKYDLKCCIDYFNVLLADRINIEGKGKPSISRATADIFLTNLMHVLIAYYFAHDNDFDLREVDICSIANYNKNAEKLRFSKQIHEFFNRVSNNL